MKAINSKRGGSHHLPCLSSLSQVPLIGNGESVNTELLTPISNSSSNHQSPNRIPLPQAPQMSAPPNQQDIHVQSTRTPLCGTPMIPNVPCSSNETIHKQSVFFPTLAPRSKSNKSHMTLDLTSTFDTKQNKKINPFPDSPKDSPTFSNMIPSSENGQDNSNVANVDDNYHLYHEPMDSDERNEGSNETSVPTTRESTNQAPPLPPTPRSSMFAALNSPIDWPHATKQQRSPTDRSPTLAHDQDSFKDRLNLNQSQASNQQRALTPSTFSDRKIKTRNKIEDDVYFIYVHKKSIERANHRSRSYHGPKNSFNPHIRDDQSLSKLATSHQRTLNSTSVMELQAANAGFAAPSPPIVPFRDHCVRELIETESNYVHALEMIITCFARPLECLLKREDSQLIFGHIRHFHHIHSLFHADLVKAAFRLFNKDLPPLPSPPNRKANDSQWLGSNPGTPTLVGNNNCSFLIASSPSQTTANLRDSVSTTSNSRAPKISTCFLNVREKFLKYGEYCSSLSKAQALLDELTSKNEAIAAQLDRCQQEANEGKFKLRDLLSLPMQRILKYHLLLAHLIKNTNSSNDDYQGLKRAHDAMVDLGQYINEVKRDTEATQIMNEIEQSIVGLNMPPNTRLIDYGRLITDGKIRIRIPFDAKLKSSHELSKLKLSAQDTRLKPKRYVFVFDKVMLICKLSGLRRYQYKEAFVLSEFEVEANPTMPSDTLQKHTSKDKWNFMFNLVRTCDKSTYTFYAKSLEMKQKWLGAIQRAMDNTRPAICCGNNNASGHEFMMHTFDRASSCDHCGKLLQGLYYQGYRCRVCFTSVHKKCLSSVRPCGPALPPKTSLTMSRNQPDPSQRQIRHLVEPISPSFKSDFCNGANGNLLQPNPQQIEGPTRNEFHNVNETRHDNTVIANSSFSRENGNRSNASTDMHNQRPVSSMINVSQQNSHNQLIQENRLLRNSTSTPIISRQQVKKHARALEDFDGDESQNELKMMAGDIILLEDTPSKDDGNTSSSREKVDDLMQNLALSHNDETLQNGNQADRLYGQNLRTNLGGHFPAKLVEIKPDMGLGPNSFDAEGYVDSYINFPLSDQPWFNDRMDRDRAQELLEGMPHETFLVRVSPKHHNSYVISLKYNNKVMHMRVYVAKDNQLYLSQNRYFSSLVELVSWYETNSLIESFNMLDACLRYPYKYRTSC